MREVNRHCFRRVAFIPKDNGGGMVLGGSHCIDPALRLRCHGAAINRQKRLVHLERIIKRLAMQSRGQHSEVAIHPLRPVDLCRFRERQQP